MNSRIDSAWVLMFFGVVFGAFIGAVIIQQGLSSIMQYMVIGGIVGLLIGYILPIRWLLK